jgi:ATP-dependent DNA helicase RecG
MEENEYIASILREPESDQVAFFPEIDYSVIAFTVCAMLNTSGGRIFVGVSQQLNFIPGTELHLAGLRQYIYNNITPHSLISIRPESYDNHPFILIEVIQGNRKPYSIDGRAYMRKEQATKQADQNYMSALLRQQRQDAYSWEKLVVMDADLNSLDLSRIRDTIKRATTLERTSRFHPDEIERFLDYYQLSRQQEIRNAAIVLYAKEPAYFIPQCRVRLIEFAETKSSNQYKDTLLINENIFVAFNRLQEYFQRHTPVLSKFSSDIWERIDQTKFSLSALDEAVINALIHRDYSDPTSEVFIGIYPDRIEIINRGTLPLSDSQLKKKHESLPPNPNITMAVFLHGIIEKVGRGTVLIAEECGKLGLKEPTWKTKNGFVTLTLYSTAKEIQLNERIIRFLRTIHVGESFSRRDYELSFTEKPISERTAREDTRSMVEGGWVSKSGEAMQTIYTRTEVSLPDIAG